MILDNWSLKRKALHILFDDNISVSCFKGCREIFSKYSKQTKCYLLCEPFLETTRVTTICQKIQFLDVN